MTPCRVVEFWRSLLPTVCLACAAHSSSLRTGNTCLSQTARRHISENNTLHSHAVRSLYPMFFFTCSLQNVLSGSNNVLASTVFRIRKVPGSNIDPQISFHSLPITGALLSTPRNAFTRSYSWVVGSNPMAWMYFYFLLCLRFTV